ncbi:MAG: asparagine synthase (glutamine-hydrolyzing) [Bacteroidetes bacterium]|nr:MAG: asparagine synthase (glutamine-hydrolyzing) [Bacteroidota bacterium]
MCGIAGIISLTNASPPPESLIVKMTDRISHRGPDGEGFLFSEHYPEVWVARLKEERPHAIINQRVFRRPVLIGHRRLSILDLSPLAGQPMRSYDDTVWITFNGEIYNYLPLRKELEALGYAFRTDHSDTEVILHAYQAWGKEAVQRLRGMFAFAIYDSRKDLLWIVRDRAGIKPMYYTIHEGQFYFASELKAILENPAIPRKINERGLYDYLTFQRVPPPETLFEGIYKMPAGTELSISGGVFEGFKPYWDVFDGVEPFKGTEAEMVEALDALMLESVNLRRQSDVPYGVYLSGGLDSSTLVAYLSGLIKDPVKTFSVGYAENESHTSYKNEFPFSRKVAEQFKCNAFEIEVTQQQYIDFSPAMTDFSDEPNPDPVAASLYFVSKLAKDNGVTVCLGGEGSDELFCGYIEWRYQAEFDRVVRNLGPAKGLLKPFLQLPLVQKRRPFYNKWYERLENSNHMFWGGAFAMEEGEKRGLLSDSFLKRLGGYNSWDALESWYQQFMDRARLPDILLDRLDKMAMAAAVEGRVPFLDHHVIRFAMGLPTSYKIRGQEEKYILKKTMESRLSKDIIYRGKIGFSSPIHEWIQQQLGVFAREKIMKFNEQTQVFDSQALSLMLSNADGIGIWRLLNIALWWEKFIENE